MPNTMISYLRYLAGTVCFVLGVPAIINFIVDPAGIYRQGRISPEAFAHSLVSSENGLFSSDDGFDERLVAKELAGYANNAECAVIGSSHVMQIGSARTPAALLDICGSVLNLAVGGAGLEDHITLAYFAAQGSKRPKKIVLGVDPWTFAFGKDQRWSSYKDDYFKANVQISGKNAASETNGLDATDMAKLANLINIDYTTRSLQTALREYKSGAPAITAAPKLDLKIGGAFPVRLRDGSHVHSAKYIATAAQATVPVGGLSYKTDGTLNQKAAIDAYRALLLWLQRQGVEPILLMTPYHENVWKAPASETAVALRATEPIVRDLGREMNLEVIGSYDPHVIGCLSSEFYDFMHPTAACLTRLRAKSQTSTSSKSRP